VLFESRGAASGEHTQMAWEVDDIETVVTELRKRGLKFEEYGLPGLKTVNGIAEVSGNYPSSGGIGERGFWFRDSEGNLQSASRYSDVKAKANPKFNSSLFLLLVLI
jgi:hypothetical protein